MKELKTPVQKFIEQLEAEKCEVYKGGRYIYTIVNPNGVKGTMIYNPFERSIEIDLEDKSYLSIDLKNQATEYFIPAVNYKQQYSDEAFQYVFMVFANIFRNIEEFEA